MNRLAIIPARGGSKRIKNKNIKLFNGKPIIIHTLETVIKTNLFKKIHISTDSKKIIKICEKKLKIDFLRPKKFSNDKAPLINVLKYVTNKYLKLGEKFDEIWLIFPCSPLMEPKDYFNIKNLINKNLKKKIVMTVSEFPAPIERSFRIGKDNELKAVNIKNFTKGKQRFHPAYFETGAVVAIPKINLQNISDKPYLRKIVPYVVEKHKSIDINNISDWKFAELIHKSVNK